MKPPAFTLESEVLIFKISNSCWLLYREITDMAEVHLNSQAILGKIPAMHKQQEALGRVMRDSGLGDCFGIVSRVCPLCSVLNVWLGLLWHIYS